ncbi:toll/interleukin-1 receptor domain-containing protein [Vibrio sp. CK2-1]|uniref:toll/interleukin-1 receptor domain-containing protein n=1 Tax=Vibrio sp. CK2-1 TaxID=2912249 RepID=UPI001F15A533|nr:toll/interleukin-1 receptor domain-containing protein [Vibrio sp. CK2-1]MCF7354852.1 toll/interleukin-1 receptor domain-containing protein [Vibrio sp. CK2-1]
MANNPPRVFVSYSHDSAEHKEWVLNFATTLRLRGIDIVLDQWDLKPGGDLPHFMESHLDSSDFILMVCTENYVKKADSGEGGVGYEKMIMTSSLLSKIDQSKVIPIIRQHGQKTTPTFMASKLYIDFSIDEEAEYSYDDLLRTLLDAPLFVKPDIGTNSFSTAQETRPQRTSDGLKKFMTAVATTYDQTSNGPTIYLSNLFNISNMHRLSLDHYIQEASKKGLIVCGNSMLRVTNEGRSYIFENGIVDL